MIEQIKEESPIERAKKRIVKLQELETKLMDASAVRTDSIFIRQSAIYENYYADVSDLLDELEKAQKKSVEWENEARLQFKLFNEMIEKERDVRQQLQKVHAEHTAMKEALEWYEDGGNYSRTEDDYRIGYPPEIIFDKGIKARTVLATLTKEDIENE